MRPTLTLRKGIPVPASDFLPASDFENVPGWQPTFEPRPMPVLPLPVQPLACPAPRGGEAQKYRDPLWRKYEPIDNG